MTPHRICRLISIQPCVHTLVNHRISHVNDPTNSVRLAVDRRATKPSKRFQDNAEKKERPQRFPKAARFQDSRASPKHRYSAICAQSLALSQTRVRLVTVPRNPRAKWSSNTCHSQQRRAKDHKVGHSPRDVIYEEDFQSVPSRHAAHITILCMAAVSYPGFPAFLRSALKPPRG